MSALEQYSIVCQAPGAAAHTVSPYSGTDLREVLGITQASLLPAGACGWIQICGEVQVRSDGGSEVAYADFRPNDARRELSEVGTDESVSQQQESQSDLIDDEASRHQKHQRLAELPPLLMEVGSYCSLVREARDVFVDGHFYSCVAMCGISLERFQRDAAKPHGATRDHDMSQIRQLLQDAGVVSRSSLASCKKMAKLRNRYAHGTGHHPEADALKALGWLHGVISDETDMMRNYAIEEGRVVRRRPASV